VNNFEKKIFSQAETSIKKSQPNLKGDELTFAIKDKGRLMLDSLQGETAYPILNKSYQECKEKQLNLGLDLQGGMNVVMEVGMDKLLENLSVNKKDPALVKAIASAKQAQSNSGDDFITLFENSWNAQNPNGRLATLYAKAENEGITMSSTNDEVIERLRLESKDAFERATEIIRTRIDQFGVSSPTVNPDVSKGRINVELAGVQNPERVRKTLESSAKLEFFRTYSMHEVSGWEEANEALVKYYKSKKGDKDTISDDTLKPVDVAKTNPGDSANLEDILGEEAAPSALDSNLSDEERRAKIAEENPLFQYIVQAFEVQQDPTTGKVINQPQLGFVLSRDTAKMGKLLRMDIVRNKFSERDLHFAWGKTPAKTDKGESMNTLYLLRGKPVLNGDVVKDADQGFDQLGQVTVNMAMNNIGAKKWGTITERNIDVPVAIVLDDLVYSAPAPRSKIDGGRSEISGDFTVEEAKDLSNILKAGKLPAPAKIIQEQVVGPTLGAEAIRGGMLSFLISFSIIFALMFLYYNSSAWVVNIALILNLLFTIGVLSALGASLTAAGIAGLVLTIGMAVDTNVIIFERIKEELTWGRSYADAVDEGYKRSYAPVLDGHITVLMTAIVLFVFGLGPVLGFATTQILGILLSLFCGIMVSRLITDVWMNKGRHFEYFTGISKKLFRAFKFDYIGWRKKAYIISGIVLLLGIGAFVNGFKYGVEFEGGRSYTVKLEKAASTNTVRDELKDYFGGERPIIKTIGNADQINLTTAYKINDEDGDKEVLAQLYKGLKDKSYIKSDVSLEKFGTDIVQSSQKVLPTISDDLRKGAIWATVIALLLIMAYIFLRFRRWQYSLGTIIALAHDVLVTMAVFSFFKDIVPFAMEIDQHFIAAILTVIGFSMNDTVVVFDRIREYFRKRPGESKKSVINAAINDTMSRTIMTSLTVFITLLVLFIFGGEVTRGFAFAMMIGVITGTYSSIFVAAPVLVDLDKSDSIAKEEDKEAKIAALKEEA